MSINFFLDHRDIIHFNLPELPEIDSARIAEIILIWINEFEEYDIEISREISNDIYELKNAINSGYFSLEDRSQRTRIMQMLYKIAITMQSNDNNQPKPITSKLDGMKDFTTNIRIKCFLIPIAIEPTYHQCYLRLGMESFSFGLFNLNYNAQKSSEQYDDYFSNEYVNGKVNSLWDIETSTEANGHFKDSICYFRKALYFENSDESFTGNSFSNIFGNNNAWILMGLGLCMYKLKIDSYKLFIEKALKDKFDNATFHHLFGFDSWSDLEKRIL
jgi:hypothetical protein